MSTSTFVINLKKVVPVGNNEVNLNAFVKVYPNPAKEQLNVSMDNSKSAISSIELIDIMGREIMTQSGINSNEYSINTTGFAPGIYILNLKTKDGSIATKRFTIQ